MTEARPAQPRAFSKVEARVRVRWRQEHDREANEQYYKGLLKKHGVVVGDSVKPLIGPPENFAMLASKAISQQPEVPRESQ